MEKMPVGFLQCPFCVFFFLKWYQVIAWSILHVHALNTNTPASTNTHLIYPSFQQINRCPHSCQYRHALHNPSASVTFAVYQRHAPLWLSHQWSVWITSWQQLCFFLSNPSNRTANRQKYLLSQWLLWLISSTLVCLRIHIVSGRKWHRPCMDFGLRSVCLEVNLNHSIRALHSTISALTHSTAFTEKSFLFRLHCTI